MINKRFSYPPPLLPLSPTKQSSNYSISPEGNCNLENSQLHRFLNVQSVQNVSWSDQI